MELCNMFDLIPLSYTFIYIDNEASNERKNERKYVPVIVRTYSMYLGLRDMCNFFDLGSWVH